MKMTKNQLRFLIREYINTWKKNYYTAYDDPFNVEDRSEMDVDIDMYPNVDGSWAVVIDCGFDESLSEPLRVFKTEEDAGAYVQKKEDVIHRAFINSGEL